MPKDKLMLIIFLFNFVSDLKWLDVSMFDGIFSKLFSPENWA
jgi:hypothetical protein